MSEADTLDIRTVTVDTEMVVRDAARREIDVRVVPWNTPIETVDGTEEFARGSMTPEGFDPSAVLLMGPEHEVHFGIGQDGKVIPTRRPQGKVIKTDDREDGQHATVRVARTAQGDEILALAADGIVTGVSLEMRLVPGGTVTEKRGGRRHSVHQRVDWRGLSPTYRPAYKEAAILAVRSKEDTTVAEATVQTPEAPAPIDYTALASGIATAVGDRFDAAIATLQTRQAAPDDRLDKAIGRIEAMEERARTQIQIPSRIDSAHPDDFGRGDWLKLVLRTLSGDTVSQAELQARVAAELITSDNLGVVPPAYLSEIIGIIDPTRPFLNSTRRLTTPRSGMQLTVPVIATRPTVGVQAAEKDELASTTTSITATNFNPITIGGYGDISLQLLKRSDPSYLEMYVDLLAEAYAIMADDKAVDALLAQGAVNEGGTLDPSDGAQFGDAWANAAAVSRRLSVDTVWLSSAAVAAFIDAKSDTTNAPLYANLAANFTAGGGVGGTISGLRPVHVPALDDESVDIIVGPSRGFAWTEDGTYTLQVDVPAKAGRDVGIVGMVWFAPLYPGAFTTYELAS